jgi:multicomponent Na+:H+ antiporter subunit C
MHTLLAIVVGCLFATALYLLMRRNVVKLIIGLGLLTHAANLLIFVAGGVENVNPPIAAHKDVPKDLQREPIANPLPQALILTAIVIGFGTQAFAVVLVHRAVQTLGTDDLDNLTTTDR